MWAVLNGSLDDYIFLYYEDGVDGFLISSDDHKIATENEFLYLNEVRDNWNEGLDCELTSEMNLTYAFHNLFSHLAMHFRYHRCEYGLVVILQLSLYHSLSPFCPMTSKLP